MARLHRRFLCSVVLVALTSHAPAFADGAAASEAFNEGQRAQMEGDLERASQAFELAYSMAPSKEALRSAVRARFESGQIARAATLAQRLRDEFAADAKSVSLADEVLAAAATRVGRLKLTCSARCSVSTAGRGLSLGDAGRHDLYINPGAVSLEIAFDRVRTVRRDVTVRAGTISEVAVEAPSEPNRPAPEPAVSAAPVKPPPAARRGPGGLSPIVPVVGAVLTLGLAGATLWSGLDTNRAHDAYLADPTDARWEDGITRQQRTNILLGVTAGAGVATVVVAAFFTRWRRGERSELTLAPSAGGLGMTYSGRF